jgi:predicted permease
VITHEFMPMLGVVPPLGREFSVADDQPGAPSVVMLGYEFWKSEFAGQADILGRTIRLNSNLYTVVGIAPRGFHGVERSPVDLFVPPTFFANDRPQGSPFTNRNFHWASVLARLEPGVGRERLAAELNAIYHTADPVNKFRASLTVIAAAPTSIVAMEHRQVQDVAVALWLYGVAAVVLLIACANVASLLLIRATGRQREIAVRLALGISRLRLARLLMTESALLAGVGSIAGLVLAGLASGVFRATLAGVDLGSGLIDLRVVSATLIATVFTALVCGLAPALVAARPDLGSVLKSGERDGSHGRGRVNSVLLVGQVALTLMLLFGAALFVRSLENLNNLDFGFDAPHLLRARLAAGIPVAQADRYFGELLRRVSELPGAQRAALATGGPFAAMRNQRLAIPGLSPIDPAHWPRLDGVTPEYFETLGMTLIRGRGFTVADEHVGGGRVVIVNDVMARRYWPAGDALGRCIQVGGDTMPCRTIVGVVHAAQQGNMPGEPIETEEALDAYYLPFDLDDQVLFGGDADAWLWVRSPGNAAQLVPSVRRIVETLGPDSPYPDVVAISTRLADEFRPWRLGATMCGIFGGAAFLLALVGLYGVLAFRVTQRTHEIGVRIALGAQEGDVRRLVVGHGLRLAALGVTIGVGASLACARLLEPLLYRTSARDPRILSLTGAALLAVTMFASYIPALRATRIDPVEALRQL